MTTAIATRQLEKEINGKMLNQDTLIEQHQLLVHKICRKYSYLAAKVGMEYEDIVSIGFIGLVKAFRYFDSKKYDVRFSTYAVPMITGEIRRQLRDQNPGVRYTRSVKDLASLITKAELQDSHIDSIVKKLNVERDKVIHALDYIFGARPRSLDKKFRDLSGQEISLHVIVGKEDDTTSIAVEEFIQTLPASEQVVVNGLIEGLKQSEIGEKLGVSQVQASRLVKKIRTKYLEFKEMEVVDV